MPSSVCRLIPVALTGLGSRFAPSAIRDESFLLKPYNPVLDVNIFDECSGVDYGDLPTIPGYLPEAHKLIEESAAAVFASGTTPIFLGGDHSVSLPLLRAGGQIWSPGTGALLIRTMIFTRGILCGRTPTAHHSAAPWRRN